MRTVLTMKKPKEKVLMADHKQRCLLISKDSIFGLTIQEYL